MIRDTQWCSALIVLGPRETCQSKARTAFCVGRRHRAFSLDLPRAGRLLEDTAVLITLRREATVSTPLVATRGPVTADRERPGGE